MIVKEYEKFVVYCEICGEKLGEYESFDRARLAIKANDWLTSYEDGRYSNYCPDCQ